MDSLLFSILTERCNHTLRTFSSSQKFNCAHPPPSMPCLPCPNLLSVSIDFSNSGCFLKYRPIWWGLLWLASFTLYGFRVHPGCRMNQYVIPFSAEQSPRAGSRLLLSVPCSADGHWVVPTPSTPGSWFTPPTSSVTRTARARQRSTREPPATTTPARRSSPSWRWVPASRCLVLGLLQPQGCCSGSRSRREWFPAR